jgi:hypothetical protein
MAVLVFDQAECGAAADRVPAHGSLWSVPGI